MKATCSVAFFDASASDDEALQNSFLDQKLPQRLVREMANAVVGVEQTHDDGGARLCLLQGNLEVFAC